MTENKTWLPPPLIIIPDKMLPIMKNKKSKNSLYWYNSKRLRKRRSRSPMNHLSPLKLRIKSVQAAIRVSSLKLRAVS